MDFLNNIVGQLGGADKIASLAKQVGLSEAQVQAAMAALGKAAPQPGDTAASAAQSTGLPLDKLHLFDGESGLTLAPDIAVVA